MPTIQGKELTRQDIGRKVCYTAPHGAVEFGEISSFRDDGSIFVRFKGPNGERCPADRLSWVFDGVDWGVK